jgi:chromosome segregation ATPase
MYIFGGRTEEGADLGDLAAFRLTTRRWYTFQNMGPSPSPRSGHSMTSYGKQIIVLAGEPSSAGREANDLAIVYVLDTTKIRYPNDGAQQATAGDRIPGKVRRPSGGEQAGMGPPRNIASRDGSIGPEQRRLNGPGRESVLGQQSLFARPNGQPGVNGNDANGVAPGSAQAQGPQGPVSKLPRASLMQALSGPPPQQQAPSRPNGNAPATNPPPRGKPPSRPDRGFGPALDTQRAQSPAQTKRTMSPAGRDSPSAKDSPNLDGRSPNLNGRRTPTGQTIRNVSSEVAEDVPTVENQTQGPMRSGSKTKHGREKGSTDSSNETGFRSVVGRPSSPPPPQRQSSNSMSRKNSTRSSQSVALLKELEAAKNRNAWYASELELAKKAGYVPNPSSSPLLDQKGAETFGENDKPLIEALITMRNELANVQASIDQQAVIAAKKIAEVEKQRDTAINEAIYAKAKLAAHGGSANSTPQLDSEARDLGIVTTERHEDISRKLATALATQKGLQQEVDMLTAELEGEKRGRQLAEETANAAQERLTDLETYKQQNSSEVERLKAELHQVHKEAREVSAAHTEAMTKVQLLQISKDELETRHKDVVESSKGHSDTFDYLREAMAASTETQKLLERKLEEERSQREKVEEKLRKLRAEHEEATVELENASRRLRDAEEMAEKHALEAKTHRQAVEAGLDRATSRDITSSFPVVSDKSATLQAQVEATNALVRKYQAAADTASEKLRGAEGRIAGLEVYQEQVSREGLSIRKQLQAALRETQSLQAANADLKHQLANQQLEANAANVQHNTLKDLLGERGISPVNAATRSRGIASPQNREGSPDQARIRELEQQLQAITQAHEESKQSFETREQEAESSYREKLAQLEQDYQAAVHYIKGTEKMLKKMKDELTKHKHENTRMKSELEEMNEKLSASAAANAAAAETSKEAAPQPPADWEHERSELSKQVDNLKYELNRSQTQLQAQLDVVRRELESSNQERERFRSGHEDSQRQFSETVQQARQELDQLQAENQLLERRALDAEQKVSLLLDQVETSVDNYRRQSRQAMGGVLTPSLGGSGGGGGAAPHGHGHSRNLSAQSNDAEGSVYSVQPPPIGADARNSMALDSLASELETLRSHWETTNKNYRISNTFDFERPRRISEEGYGAGGGGEISKEQNEQREAGTGRVLLSPTTMQGGTSGSPPKSPGLELSSSLADWRKRLEGKEEEARRSGSALSTGSGSGGRKGSLLGVEVEEKGAEGKHGL